ncbi:DUF309 domain-containing protein [Halobellus limi]|uniref:DUF309 domain-containing protein n=1 Tax=Halobellus limi TaxID=699433 RepID=A0A1H6C5J8_9EURY|nr:DUF309 domain-containing protein [Halobellus limi]QCC48599.1 DUF309 domain-containing protein [Halobellus limi]SEG67646.1 protein of unknown function [Halobellus limi]
MQEALRVGVAVFNAGDYHVAHEAWEEPWLALADGTPEERLLHGLIQYAAAVHHGRRRNWSGQRGLAESAAGYLAAVDDPRVNVDEVRAYLRRLAADPELAERRRPPALRYDGETLEPTDLSFEDVATAVTLLAAEYESFDAAVVDDAIRYAREELAGDSSPEGTPQRRSRGFVGMLFSFAADRAQRSLVYERLRGHVERRRSQESDVSGLFD